MDGPNDTLIPPNTAWLHDPAAQAVCKALSARGATVLFVGGCVRNALMDAPDSDIDLATDTHPDDVMKLAADAGLGAVPTGIEHGTVTVVSEGRGFEVTTFRKDVQTDGRRAVVAYSTNIEDDAKRRDFTMNALYATPDGRVIDPLNGLPDLRARRVVFIEDADARIKEDYLRILRFFRFSAWYAQNEAGFDADTLNAIARNAAGLEHLSAERIGTEMRKLLAAPDPVPAIAAMKHNGVLSRILPGADDLFLGPVVAQEAVVSAQPDWVLRLAALGGSDTVNLLRLSKKEARSLDTFNDIAWSGMPEQEAAYRHGKRFALGAMLLRAAAGNSPVDPGAADLLDAAEQAVFPLSASDLMPKYSGPELGQALARLERLWIASGFELSRDALLAQA